MGPSASPYSVGVPEEDPYAAEYPARTFPCQRFDLIAPLPMLMPSTIVFMTGGAACKSSVEALTGERAGRVFSRVRIFLRDADAVRRSGRPHLERRYREVRQSPARSETPC